MTKLIWLPFFLDNFLFFIFFPSSLISWLSWLVTQFLGLVSVCVCMCGVRAFFLSLAHFPSRAACACVSVFCRSKWHNTFERKVLLTLTISRQKFFKSLAPFAIEFNVMDFCWLWNELNINYCCCGMWNEMLLVFCLNLKFNFAFLIENDDIFIRNFLHISSIRLCAAGGRETARSA